MSIILRKKSQTTSASASEKKMKEMIESQIKSILSNFAGISRSAFIGKAQYFLVFAKEVQNSSKVLELI